jgi:AcrR family transcriptional regulator
MAKINLARRAEIGQEKRARTRGQLLAAARALFADRSWASVTIDDLVREAGVAKGTFYVHFQDMHALTVAVADDLISEFDELIQPERTSVSNPLLRIALGCNAFIEAALDDPAWGSLVARMARSYPSVGETARARLREDLAEALKEARPPGLSLTLALEVVVGVVLQTVAAIGEGRLIRGDRPGAVAAALGAVGVGRARAASVLAQLERTRAALRANQAPRAVRS